jgi:translation initiation factor 3 subunit F
VGGALLGTVYTNKVHITECFALVVDQGDETNVFDIYT